MNLRFLKQLRAQTLHHKLMLVLSLPMLLWVLSGCYFVWMDLGYIRGDHYVEPAKYIEINAQSLTFSDIAQSHTDATKIDLVMIAKEPYYRVFSENGTALINANTGKSRAQLSQAQAVSITQSIMANKALPFKARLINDNAPNELSPRHLPVWQVSYEDRVNSTIYISASKGDVVARRHDFWRIFDVFWRIHIMDYDDGANVNNWLLFIATVLALVATVSGIKWQSKRLKRGRI